MKKSEEVLIDLSSLNEKKPVSIEINGKRIALLLINGKPFCFEGTCTHQGADLSKGMVEGNTVICPNHHVQFDCTDGSVIKNLPPEYGQATSLRTYKTELTGNKVKVTI